AAGRRRACGTRGDRGAARRGSSHRGSVAGPGAAAGAAVDGGGQAGVVAPRNPQVGSGDGPTDLTLDATKAPAHKGRGPLREVSRKSRFLGGAHRAFDGCEPARPRGVARREAAERVGPNEGDGVAAVDAVAKVVDRLVARAHERAVLERDASVLELSAQ